MIEDPTDVAHRAPAARVDDAPAEDIASDPLLDLLRRIESMPVSERAGAIESLDRSVVAALGELEQL